MAGVTMEREVVDIADMPGALRTAACCAPDLLWEMSAETALIVARRLDLAATASGVVKDSDASLALAARLRKDLDYLHARLCVAAVVALWIGVGAGIGLAALVGGGL